MQKRHGFTIIEILIVIAVIAILIGIALPRFKGMQDEGRIVQAKSELRTLQTALESYYIHNNYTYPAAANLMANLTNTTPSIIGNASLADPFNLSGNYSYAVDAVTPKYYVMYSVGPNADGSAVINVNGTVTETNGKSCIYVTNGNPKDVQP